MSRPALWRSLTVAGVALAALTGCENPAQEVEESVDQVEQGVQDAEQKVEQGVEGVREDVQGDDEEGGSGQG